MRISQLGLIVCIALLGAACGSREPQRAATPAPAVTPAPAAGSAATTTTSGSRGDAIDRFAAAVERKAQEGR